jgi:hypothetical protein
MSGDTVFTCRLQVYMGSDSDQINADLLAFFKHRQPDADASEKHQVNDNSSVT